MFFVSNKIKIFEAYRCLSSIWLGTCITRLRETAEACRCLRSYWTCNLWSLWVRACVSSRVWDASFHFAKSYFFCSMRFKLIIYRFFFVETKRAGKLAMSQVSSVRIELASIGRVDALSHLPAFGPKNQLRRIKGGGIKRQKHRFIESRLLKIVVCSPVLQLLTRGSARFSVCHGQCAGERASSWPCQEVWLRGRWCRICRMCGGITS